MLSPYNKNTHSNHIPGKKFKMVTQKKPSAKFSPPGKRHEVSSVCIANKSTQTKQGRWTKHERLAFLRGLRKFGKSRWKEISTLIPTRDTIQVKTHAQTVLKLLAGGRKIFTELDIHEKRLVTDKRDANIPMSRFVWKSEEVEIANALIMLKGSTTGATKQASKYL